VLLGDGIDPLAHAFQAESNGIFIDGTSFLKTDPHIPLHQENNTHTKSGLTPAARRKLEIETDPNYSLSEFPLVITRNTSISKKCSPSYTLSFYGTNSGHMENSFYIVTISM
jgi:hypothetical protein